MLRDENNGPYEDAPDSVFDQIIYHTGTRLLNKYFVRQYGFRPEVDKMKQLKDIQWHYITRYKRKHCI